MVFLSPQKPNIICPTKSPSLAPLLINYSYKILKGQHVLDIVHNTPSPDDDVSLQLDDVVFRGEQYLICAQVGKLIMQLLASESLSIVEVICSKR